MLSGFRVSGGGGMKERGNIEVSGSKDHPHHSIEVNICSLECVHIQQWL